MSLPELFRQRERLVGCLTLRRFHEPSAGVSTRDARWLDLVHPMGTSGSRLLLATHAYGDATLRCLEANRPALELDRRFWGDAIHRLLPLDLLESSLIPSDACLSISIVPVLLVVARVSEGCRQRCLAYLEAQTHTIAAALERLPAHAAEARRQLAGFADNTVQLWRLLIDAPPPFSVSTAKEAFLVEHWLDTGDLPDAEKVAAAHRARYEHFAHVLGAADTRSDLGVAVLRTR